VAEYFVYTQERRKGAPRVKTAYQAIPFWATAVGAGEVPVPIGKAGAITAFAWQLPDGTVVDAFLQTEEEAESRDFMEWVADELVRDPSPANQRKLQRLLKERNK